MPFENPAALKGWVKGKDPKTGRVFYANHVTRSTQWDPPMGWKEEEEEFLPPPPPPPPPRENDDLPANWEVMHDPTTGKPFYVDHESKITTWTRPTAFSSTPPQQHQQQRSSSASSLSIQTPSWFQDTSVASAPVPAQRSYSNSNSSSSAWQARDEDSAATAAYFSHLHSEHDDFSDSLPTLEFQVRKVPDQLHSSCPNCNVLFTYSLRRHHCRLCGDVFCDSCSSHRVELPLEGPEFEKPVRVCDLCFKDVDKGNFFSMRRYLTPLQLFDANQKEVRDENQQGGVATQQNVEAALCALAADLDSLLTNSSTFEEKVTIPPDVLVPAICRHLALPATADRAIRALASLLALGSIVMNAEFARLVYKKGGKQVMDSILVLLERSGTNRRTLFVQEQAARALFYLLDSSVVSSLTSSNDGNDEDDGDDEHHAAESLDIHRALRSMLDHVSVSKNPALQRWAAACIRNLIAEDQRRTCLAINDVAGAVASGQEHDGTLAYDSFLPQLVSTGGIMILCSIIGADDADTRSHATGALSATIAATRAIDSSLMALSEMTGGRAGSVETKDGAIVRAIVAGGGCGSSLSQLLLSAENAVVHMGCSFAASLVLPLFTNPRGSISLSAEYDPAKDQDGLGACREAALAIASGGCLPALLSVVRDAELGGRIARPLELKKCAMETLAAVVFAVGQMGKALVGTADHFEEALQDSTSSAAASVSTAIATLNKEGVVHVALALLESSSSQSLLASRDTPSSRIREAAGIVIASMTGCSSEAIETLQSMNAVSAMLAASNDAGAATPSTLRGDGAVRCSGMLETSAAIIMYEWKNRSPKLLDRLLEAIDAGAVTTVSRILASPLDLESQDKSVGAMKARDACCRILCALFGIARTDETGIGLTRLYQMVDADSKTYKKRGKQVRNAPRDVTTTALWILQAATAQAKNEFASGSKGPHYNAALMDLVEASLLSAGSFCGSSVAPGSGKGVLFKTNDEVPTNDEDFKRREQESCAVACDVLVYGTRQRQAVLPTLLVGGFGEKSVSAALRLALAVAQNGTEKEHAKLAMSGILIPINDMLRVSLNDGDLFKFSASLAVIRFCGPHIAAEEGNGLQSVRESIRVATNVLTLPVNPNASMQQIETQESLKSECISALEALSKNASLWNAISKDALPSVVSYLHSSGDMGLANQCQRETRLAALRAVQRIIQLPSHTLSAAQCGIAEPLANIIASNRINDDASGGNVLLRAMEVLHVISRSDDARRAAHLLECGAVAAVCGAVGDAATDNPKQPTDPRADITFLGLDILHSVMSDIERSLAAPLVLQSPAAMAFVDAVAHESSFVRALCSTLLVGTKTKLAGFEVPQLYGSQLVHVDEKCAGFKDTHDAANSLFFTCAVYCCAIESPSSVTFWNNALLRENCESDSADCEKVAAVLCAHFLALLGDDESGPFVPLTSKAKQDYATIFRPLVRHRLLDELKECVVEKEAPPVLAPAFDDDSYMLSLLKEFSVPQQCLSLCRDPSLLGPAFDMIKLMMEEYPDDIPNLFIDNKVTVMALFDLLNIESSAEVPSSVVEDIRSTIASMLGTLAEQGLLAEAVDRLDVRSSAIAALAAACLAEDKQGSVMETLDDEDEDKPSTSARMSSRCMQCMVELCAAENAPEESSSKVMHLAPQEAEAIATRLGKKICHMVISRFLERAKLEQYEIEDEELITDAPDVRMLCAVAQHEKALKILCSLGGLNALSLIAAEGELQAILSMQKACEDDPMVVLKVDGHLNVMDLFSEEKEYAPWHSSEENSRRIEEEAFTLLTSLSMGSMKGKRAIVAAEQSNQCIARASEVISALVADSDADEETDDVPEAADTGDEITDDESSVVEESALPEEKSSKPIAPVKPQAQQAKVVVDDPSLEIAAFSFLSELVLSKKCRGTILENAALLEATTILASQSASPQLQYSAVSFLTKVVPFLTKSGLNTAVTPTKLADVFHSVLKAAQDTPSKPTKRPSARDIVKQPQPPGSSNNLLHSAVISGIEAVFECVDADVQLALLQDVSCRFTKLVNSFTVGRSVASESDRTNGGLLACNLSSLVVLARAKDSAHDVLLNSDLAMSMVRLVQWHYDPKLSTQEKTDVYWKAAVTHSLQFLSFVSRNDETLVKAGVRLQDFVGASLMVSRPGKAPRKAPDFVSALKKAEDEGVAANVVAARRIQERISLLE